MITISISGSQFGHYSPETDQEDDDKVSSADYPIPYSHETGVPGVPNSQVKKESMQSTDHDIGIDLKGHDCSGTNSPDLCIPTLGIHRHKSEIETESMNSPEPETDIFFIKGEVGEAINSRSGS